MKGPVVERYSGPRWATPAAASKVIPQRERVLDRMVRESPDTAYEKSFIDALHAQGYLQLFD